MDENKILEKIESLEVELKKLVDDSNKQIEEFIKQTNLQAATLQGKIEAYKEMLEPKVIELSEGEE